MEKTLSDRIKEHLETSEDTPEVVSLLSETLDVLEDEEMRASEEREYGGE